MTDDRWARIDTILQAALVRPTDARELFVKDACGDDATLRDEVLSLLAYASSAADFLERPAGNFAAESGTMALAAGTRFGPYEILTPIGAGGMGEVYRARDTRLDRTVAVKILPPHLRANPRLLARFEREARATAGLNHPNICTLHDVGYHEGIDFLVMEHIEGETLRSRLLRGPLSIEKTVRCGREVADALAAAHRQGLVHRDIKPSNIIVTPSGHAKVVDFGLARLAALISDHARVVDFGLAGHAGRISSEDATRTEPTESGVVVGTPHYMSPEQAGGLPLDPRTDIFSLGAVMFECLTGRLPFDGEMRDDYLQHLLSGEPRAIDELRADVPANLQALIARCLERDVSRRIESATKLTAELDRIASGRVAGSTVVPRLRRRVIAAVLVAAAAFAVLWRVVDIRFLSPAFEQLTFARARITSARFVADGRGIIYSEAREKAELELLRIDPEENRVARPLGFAAGTEILAASSGELAVSVNRRFIMGERFTGTLAVTPIDSSTPRETRNDVEQADWDSSGKQMVVVRSPGGMGGTTSLDTRLGTNAMKPAPRSDSREYPGMAPALRSSRTPLGQPRWGMCPC